MSYKPWFPMWTQETYKWSYHMEITVCWMYLPDRYNNSSFNFFHHIVFKSIYIGRFKTDPNLCEQLVTMKSKLLAFERIKLPINVNGQFRKLCQWWIMVLAKIKIIILGNIVQKGAKCSTNSLMLNFTTYIHTSMLIIFFRNNRSDTYVSDMYSHINFY